MGAPAWPPLLLSPPTQTAHSECTAEAIRVHFPALKMTVSAGQNSSWLVHAAGASERHLTQAPVLLKAMTRLETKPTYVQGVRRKGVGPARVETVPEGQ